MASNYPAGVNDAVVRRSYGWAEDRERWAEDEDGDDPVDFEEGK